MPKPDDTLEVNKGKKKKSEHHLKLIAAKLQKFSKIRKYLPYFIYFGVTVVGLWYFLSSGFILTLDIVFTPNTTYIDILYGLNEYFLFYSRLPLFFILNASYNFMPVWITQRVILFLILFISGISAHALCPSKNEVGKYFAGILYMINPFTYVRFLAGHWLILLAYAVTPFAVKSFIEMLEDPSRGNIIKALLWITLVGVFNVHILILNFIVFLVIFIFKMMQIKDIKVIKQRIMKPVSILAVFYVLLNLYWILPVLTAESTILSQIGHGDIMAFAPKPASNFNIAFTIASMYGFWRGGYIYTKDLLPFWYLIFIFMLYLAVHGAVTTFRDKKLGANTKAFVAVAVIAFIFGIGAASHGTAPLFNWLFEHVFFFRGFRDSHKFVALLVLAYAYFGGLGIDDFARHLRDIGNRIKKEQVVAVVVVALALSSPFMYSYTMFGFHDQLKPIDYPESWYETNDFLNQDKEDFNVLFFPWHLYMDFHWIENKDKRIANPASSFFDKTVIQGDNMEAGGIYSQSTDPTSKYTEFLLQNREKITNFGELVTPINVKYITLAKEVDYKNYDFLYAQEDLEVVLENEDLIVFKNKHEVAKIYEVGTVNQVQSLDEFLEVSKEQDITGGLYILGGKTEIQKTSEKRTLNYTKKSPVKYEVEEPTMKYVVFTTSQGVNADYWKMGNASSTKNLGLTPAFIVEEETGNIIKYTRFYNTYLPGYIISMATFAALIFIFIRGRKGGRGKEGEDRKK